MMWRCLSCGAEVEEYELDVETWEESRCHFGIPCTERFTEVRCPECGSEDVEEVIGD